MSKTQFKNKTINSCRNDRDTKNKHSLSISIYGNSEMESDDSVTDSIVACRDGLCLWGSSWSASVTPESDEWSDGGCMLGSHLKITNQ